MTLDCRSCGLCCVSPYAANTYVDVTPRDEEKLGKKFVRLHVIDGSIAVEEVVTKRGPLMGVRMNRCAALRGSVGFAVHCSVYENRPAICRVALMPGDEACLDIRRAAGLDASLQQGTDESS